ncbi:hypothetical protein D9757_005435 [Collybiopsis confluens]|uniref:Uncharacterized protein n=1 Tax=Collybiopsis confluens TaxID=2823264 RepID=A0A8H5HLE1_9AGAR|nr:hypothetical protein D9757_005435 [Collybiopsis confluens]
MNRPRPSVLAQFDPLLQEEPEYLSGSEESDPDKENMAPESNELSVTTFFNRTAKHDRHQPVTLTKRLVDIGDVTICEDVEEPRPELQQLDVDTKKAFSSLQTTKHSNVAHIMPRAPFTEIDLKHQKRHTPSPKRFTDSLSAAQPPRQAGSALNSLVDSVNRAGKSFGNLLPAPRISVNDSDIEDDTASSLIAAAAPFTLRGPQPKAINNLPASSLRLAPPHDRSQESNRLSLDLHSSFGLHLQSETSFDLLNDRVSFFDAQGEGMDAFLRELDDESDGEIAKLERINDKDSNCDTKSNGQLQSDNPGGSLTYVTDYLDKLSISSQNQMQLSPGPSPSIFGPFVKPSDSMVTPASHRTTVTSCPALLGVKRTKPSSRNVTDAAPQRKHFPALTNVSSETSTHKASSRPVIPSGPAVQRSNSGLAPIVKGLVKPRAAPGRILPSDSHKFDKSGAVVVASGRFKGPALGKTRALSTTSAIPKQAPVGVSGALPPVSKLPAPSGATRLGRNTGLGSVGNVSESRIALIRGAPRRLMPNVS